MDQAGLTFGPELLLVRTGYPVEFRNSDDTLHNVRVSHEETRASAFNVAIPTGESYTYTFERDGFYRVGCDIHPAMAASVFAASSPFTAVAEADGRFAFDEVPPGAWTVTVYADGKQLHKDVEVAGGVTNVTIVSAAKSKLARCNSTLPRALQQKRRSIRALRYVPVVSQPFGALQVQPAARSSLGLHRDRFVVPHLAGPREPGPGWWPCRRAHR